MPPVHYTDVIMGTIASQITSLTIVYSTVYSDADQTKYQSSALLSGEFRGDRLFIYSIITVGHSRTLTNNTYFLNMPPRFPIWYLIHRDVKNAWVYCPIFRSKWRLIYWHYMPQTTRSIKYHISSIFSNPLILMKSKLRSSSDDWLP